MALVIPAGFALASFRGMVAFDPEEIVFTMGFELSGGASVAIANDLFSAWHTELADNSTTDWEFTGVTLKEGPVSTGPTYESTDAVTNGLVTETGAACNTAVLVRKGTALGGRKGRGRAYTCGQAYAGVYGMSGELDAGQLALLDTAWFDLMGLWQAVAGVDGLVLLHSDATTPTPIVSLNPQKRLATQRRRLRP